MKKILVLLALLVFEQGFAQVSPHPYNGTISTAGIDCLVSTRCVTVTIPPETASATITVDATSGSWSGTIQFEGSVDGAHWIAMVPTSNSSSSSSSTTSTGVWQFNPSSYIQIRARASARASGTAPIIINWSTATASSGGGGATSNGSGAPAGSCSNGQLYTDNDTGTVYGCNAGSWLAIGPGAAGSTTLDSVLNPTVNKAFDMTTKTLVWNWATGNTSTSNLFSVADNATNTGTGYLFTVSSGSSSATKPFRVCYQGTSNCITYDSGTLAAIGTSLIAANTSTTATKWATARNLAGNSVDGSANVAFANKFIVQGTSDSGLSGAQFLGALATGPLKVTTTTGVLSAAAYTDIVSLWASGTCTGFLKNDGTCASSSGSGTVTVVGAGSLTNTALVTGGGTTTVQTPSATATMDTSGNISTPGTISAGVGGSVAGGLEMTQGTANSLGSNAFLIQAPASISTSFGWTSPAAENGSAGILHVGAASSHLSALTVSSVALTELSTQAADTVVSNATGGAAVPTAVAWPTSGTNGCAGSADTVIYNTTTHTLGCHQISGSGTVNSGTASHLAYYASSTTAVSDMGADFVFSTHTLSTASTAILDLSAATGTAAFKVPTTTTNTASAAGAITYDSTNSNYHANSGADSLVGIVPTASIPTNGHLIDASVSSSKLLLHDSGVVSANVVNASSPGAGLAHFAGGTQTVTSSAVVGADMSNATVTATQLAAQYSKGSCTEVWGGSGTSFAMTSGDDAIVNNACYNDSGVTRTITAVKCRSDNAANTTTVNPTFGSAGTGTTILSGALTCGNSYAYSSSGTVSNASWTTGAGIDPGMATVGNATSIAVIIEYTF